MNENKFDGMGNIYAKFRPNYPKDFIDFLFTDLNLPKTAFLPISEQEQVF